MGNFKVKVNNAAESREAQELFLGLGLKRRSWSEHSEPPLYICNWIEGEFSNYSLGDRGLDFVKELTLPELRAMVNPSLKDRYLEQRKKINDACASVIKKQDDLLTTMLNHSAVSINDQYAEIEQVRQDAVNQPSHYTQGKVECIDALESATIGKSGIEAVCVANVIKYLWRYEEKNGLEDVKKAQWYLERLVASMDS